MQKYVKLEHGKELVDLSIETNLTEDNFVLLEQVQFASEPLKLGVESFRRQDSTLLSTDAIFHFIIAKLENFQSKFSIQLAAVI